MAGFSTGMARIGGERESAVWHGWAGATALSVDQQCEEVVLRDLLLADGVPTRESVGGQGNPGERVCAR